MGNIMVSASIEIYELFSQERKKMRKRILVIALLLLLGSGTQTISNLNKKSFTAEADGRNIADLALREERLEKGNEEKKENEEKQTERVMALSSYVPSCQTGENKVAPAIQAEVKTMTQSNTVINLYENRWNIYLTKEEIDLLAKIVWVEACGEPVEGQEAVVEVIFNRMTDAEYPNTLYDVLSQNQPVQFSSWKLRDIARPTEKEYQSIYAVLYGQTNLLQNQTVYFSTFPLTGNIDQKICNHYFCYD